MEDSLGAKFQSGKEGESLTNAIVTANEYEQYMPKSMHSISTNLLSVLCQCYNILSSWNPWNNFN